MVFRRDGWEVLNPMRTHAFARRWFVAVSLLGAATVAGGSGCRPSGAAREVPPNRVCEIHLEAIGKAVVEYRTQHGDLPHVVSGPRALQHSWRVLLTPSLIARGDRGNTIDYRFTEPWDSPHNQDTLLKSCLSWASMYTCPLESQRSDYPNVSYVMLVRPPLKDANTARLVEPTLPDDAVLIVESANCGIKYFEPKDLDWETLWKGDSPFGPGKLNSLHRDVVKAVRVDGKVIDIPKTISKEKLRKLLSGTGG